MTMYFGVEMSSYGLIYEGDSLYDWYRKKHSNLSSIKASDYLPRRVLGDYLNDFYQLQIARMRKYNINFQEVNHEVIDIQSLEDDTIIKTKDYQYKASLSVLCVGHQINKNKDVGILTDFLNYDDLNKIEDRKIVALQGMGLTAFDVISRLTEGRGGSYKKTNNTKLSYTPSGKEPKIHLYSRGGVFNSGRAVNNDPNFIYQPVFLPKTTSRNYALAKKTI